MENFHANKKIEKNNVVKQAMKNAKKYASL